MSGDGVILVNGMTATSVPVSDGGPFAALGLCRELVEAIAACGYREPTPIQRESLALSLAGRDVLGQAQTGTGKTGAYLWPMLQRLAKEGKGKLPRGLVLCPTRELAVQVYESLLRYRGDLRLRPVLCVGGVSPEEQALDLRQGCDAVVGTPGRMTELVMAEALKLDDTEYVVLDEADRLLELGFFTETRRLLRATGARRQTMFFSATLSREIESWAGTILNDPIRVEAAPPGTLVESVREVAVRLRPSAKAAAIVALLKNGLAGAVVGGVDARKVLVFVNHRRAVDALAGYLVSQGVACGVLHGGMQQPERQAALDTFKAGAAGVLVATDVAARGLEIPGVTMVVNGEMPTDALEYVHRSGRTARMGRDGLSVSLVSDEEVPMLRAAEAVTGRAVPVGVVQGFDVAAKHVPVLTASWSEAEAGKSGGKKAGAKKSGAKKANSGAMSEQAVRAKSVRKKIGPKKVGGKKIGAKKTGGKKVVRKAPEQTMTQGQAKARNQSRLARKANPSKGGKLKVVSKRGGARGR